MRLWYLTTIIFDQIQKIPTRSIIEKQVVTRLLRFSGQQIKALNNVWATTKVLKDAVFLAK